MKFLFIILALVTLKNYVYSQEIDLFTAISTVSAGGPGAIEIAEESVTDPVSIIGGTRILRATRTASSAPSLTLRCAAIAGFLAYSADVTVSGECRAIYAGDDGNGLTPTNFIQSGCDCWNLHMVDTDNDVVLEFIARSTLQSDLLVSTLPIQTAVVDQDICFPFSGNRTVYSSIDHIEIGIIGNRINIDANIGYSCCQPRLSCWHTVTDLNDVMVSETNIGDTIRLGIMCENYDSLPESIEEFEISFGFPQTIGRMDDTTITCNSAAMNPTVTGNALTLSAILNENELVSCVVEVDLFANGIANDIAADITSLRTPDVTFKSNANMNTQGTVDFCKPPEPSTVIVGNPPTDAPTLQPTPEPPTATAAPTTEPPTGTPTTLSPTEPSQLICISPRIIDGMCQCQTFPCHRLPDSDDIQCETEDWYCYFITMAPSSGSFRVSYGGFECFCSV